MVYRSITKLAGLDNGDQLMLTARIGEYVELNRGYLFEIAYPRLKMELREECLILEGHAARRYMAISVHRPSRRGTPHISRAVPLTEIPQAADSAIDIMEIAHTVGYISSDDFHESLMDLYALISPFTFWLMQKLPDGVSDRILKHNIDSGLPQKDKVIAKTKEISELLTHKN